MIIGQRVNLPSCQCLLHPEESIIRICVNAKCKSNAISCGECTISQSLQCLSHKDQLLTLQKFVNYVSTFHDKTDTTATLKPLMAQISKENPILLDVKQKMDNLKNEVKETISTLIAKITIQFSELEVQISKDLDQQLAVINQNFQACKMVIQSMQNYKDENAKLLLKFQQINDTKVLTEFITNIRTDLIRQQGTCDPIKLQSESSNAIDKLEKSIKDVKWSKSKVLNALHAKLAQEGKVGFLTFLSPCLL
jgi:hypothetical protein